jgi:hypothetical protein
VHDGIGIAELRFSPSSSSHLGKLFLLPSRRSLFLREAKLSLSRSGPGREELTLMRGRQQLLLLLFILSAAGSRIASADTNPQDGNISFSAILVGTQKKKPLVYGRCSTESWRGFLAIFLCQGNQNLLLLVF